MEKISAREIAKFLNVSQRTVERWAGKGEWKFELETGVGGTARKYIFRDLPQNIQGEINSARITNALACNPQKSVAPVQQSAVSTVPAARQTGPATDRQREIADARAGILGYIDQLMTDSSLKLSRSAAIQEIIDRASAGTLPKHITALVEVANARASGTRTLSRRTVYNWAAEVAKAKAAGAAVVALTPKVPQPSMDIPPWAADLLAEFQHPQKRSLRWAVRRVCDRYNLHEDVLYERARRFFAKIGSAELQRGRMGSQARKAELAFKRRKTGHMLPGDGYTADGHTFDAEISHPEKFGKPFRPEMTAILDVATRRAVGWSVNLAESTIAVLDALRNACETCGVPALFYTDNGPGYKNHVMTAKGTGLLGHLGITPTNSRPYNSQARGIIEKSHQSIWVDAAKELPTYIGKDMDRQMSIKVHKLTRAEIVAGRRSPLLMEFAVFLKFAESKINEYNNRPHRALPKRYDDSLGRKRHLTPMEAWAEGEPAALAAGLWVISPDDARDLIRPQVTRVAQRCELTVFNNLYFSKDLEQHNGERVRVAYDVRDARTVIVYNEEGQYLCHAHLDGNASPYFGKPVIEQAQDQRTARRLKLIDKKRADVEGEFTRDIKTLEDAPSPTLANVIAQADLAELDAALVPASARPMFVTDADRYEWLMRNQDAWNDTDLNWLHEHVATESYAAMADYWADRNLQWQNPTHYNLKEA